MSRRYLRTADINDLYVVFSDLSDISKSEFCEGGSTWWRAMAACHELVKLSGSMSAVAVVQDGEPVAVFGHNRHPEEKYTRVTWFAARPQFFEGIGATLVVRRYLKTLGSRFPRMVFESYSRSQHPEVRRWFGVLGFTYISKGDGYTKFAYRPPLCEGAKSAA